MKTLSPAVTWMLTIELISTIATPFSFEPVSIFHRAIPPTAKLTTATTICNAKLQKISSNYDLEAILSNEKDLNAEEDDTALMGRKRNSSNDLKKKMMKRKMKQEKQVMQQKQKQRTQNSSVASDISHMIDGYEDSSLDAEPDTDYVSLMQEINFSAYEVPLHVSGKRIDAVLVEVLNEGCDGNDYQKSNPLSISRSQCGTLLSSGFVFVVPPEDANEFTNAWKDYDETTSVPRGLIEQRCIPIQRKSHILEPSSIVIYPSRDSLLSTSSSSTLLSNFISPTEIIAQKIPLDILYEDEHMVVINKQAGMVVHPAAGNWDGTVVNALSHYLMNESSFGPGEFFTDDAKGVDSSYSSMGNNEADVNQNDSVTNSIPTLRPGIVHRLDKGTSGVLVVAKTSLALANLSQAFADRKVKKQYIAVAIGNPGEDQWIDKPIGRHPLHRQKMRVVPNPSSSMASRGHAHLTSNTSMSVAKQGRPAMSHIHTIHHDGKLSVVQVRIATGRTHQIRVHLQDHGTPIYGDDVYGLADWNKALNAKRGITRPLLHAQRLEINHPVTGETLVFEAPLAPDMSEVINAILPAGVKLS
ncbi:hypothetical protein ACHAXA_010674 [Cyclostephanos tholiformis]|uniref:Pseudouridine synthase RsuA/RluA-like domain-containing protein n=1 Tax=Cyclostephanos tholiformis TaxID=382380 RepID=A0ABD3SEA7_9STRA